MENEEYIGKYLIAGITCVDDQDVVVRRFQKHGVITAVTSSGITFVNPKTSEEFRLPPDTDSLNAAEPGAYHLKSCGDVVTDPDYVSTWTVYPGQGEEEAS